MHPQCSILLILTTTLHSACCCDGKRLKNSFSRADNLLLLFLVLILTVWQHIKNVTVPLLIMHGEEDTIVPASHGRDLHAAGVSECARVSLFLSDCLSLSWDGEYSSSTMPLYTLTITHSHTHYLLYLLL